jgi:hypothetical protein
MIVGCILDYYIIYVLLLKVTTKGKGYNLQKQKNKILMIIKNVYKFGFVASLT